jgi:hypothetical protein
MVREALVQYAGDGAAASRLLSDLRSEFYDARALKAGRNAP